MSMSPVVWWSKVDKFMCGKMRIWYVIIWIEEDVGVVVYVEVDAAGVVFIFVIFHVLVIVVVVAIVGYWLLARGRMVSAWLTADIVCFVIVDHDGLGLLAAAAAVCGMHVAFGTSEDGRRGKEMRGDERKGICIRF